MKTFDQSMHAVADLHWLAMLLTGSRDIGIDVATEVIASAGDDNAFFSSWMSAWARRVTIAKALSAVRQELAASAQRTALGRENGAGVSPHSWMLDRRTTKSNVERALLSIDLFPRAAVLLSLFEGVPLEDAAVLLDVEAGLVRKGQAAGAVELTGALARMQGWRPNATGSNSRESEFEYV